MLDLLHQRLSDCVPILHYAAGLGVACYTTHCGWYSVHILHTVLVLP